MKKRLGRIPLPNKPPKIIDASKRRLLKELEEKEAQEDIDDEIFSRYTAGL